MSYSYDRRRGIVAADDPTAAKAVKPKPIVPSSEHNEVLESLTAAKWAVKEWVIRSNPDAAIGSEYGATHETYQKVSKVRDELDDLTEKIRHLRV